MSKQEISTARYLFLPNRAQQKSHPRLLGSKVGSSVVNCTAVLSLLKFEGLVEGLRLPRQRSCGHLLRRTGLPKPMPPSAQPANPAHLCRLLYL